MQKHLHKSITCPVNVMLQRTLLVKRDMEIMTIAIDKYYLDFFLLFKKLFKTALISCAWKC